MGNNADCCWDGKGAPGQLPNKGSIKQAKKAGKNIQAAQHASGQADETFDNEFVELDYEDEKPRVEVEQFQADLASRDDTLVRVVEEAK